MHRAENMLPQLVHLLHISVQAMGIDEDSLGDLVKVSLVLLHMCASTQTTSAKLSSSVKCTKIKMSSSKLCYY